MLPAGRWRSESQHGQALVLVALCLPLLFAILALVVDGATLMAKRRAIQNAADAAALAGAQQLPASGPCLIGACQNSLRAVIEEYSAKNGGPTTLLGLNSPPGGRCRVGHPEDTNCYTNPYPAGLAGNDQLVEVRLQMPVTTFFTAAAHIIGPFSVAARAVASASPETATTTTPGTVISGTVDPDTTIPGGTHTTTDPDIVIGSSGVGFAMSMTCDAIDYSGSGAGNDPADGNKPWVLGAFATNGGLTMSGAKPKKITSLYYGLSGRGGGASACPSPTTNVPPGTCTAQKWGDSSDTDNLCVKTLVDLNQNNTMPVNWPIPPPNPLPTPEAGPWNAATDYPSKCVDLGSSGTISIPVNGWQSTHSPGIYCVRGTATLQLNGADVSGGDGYTFFALDSAKIQTAGNATVAKYYWPHQCDANRPDTWTTDQRPATYFCAAFGKTLWTNHGYDPQLLLYANSQASDRTNCPQSAICLSGQGGNLTGDIMATQPGIFPPSLTQTGAAVFVAGGGLSAGKGFIESWQLSMQGNTGTYQGTGTPVNIPGATHTTTDPDQTITGQTHPGTTVAGSTTTITTGTTIGLDE